MHTRTLSLNGTWQYTPQAHVLLKPGGVTEESTENLPSGGEMLLPMNWQRRGLHNFHGRVRFERSFEFDGLQPGETSAWLVFRAVDYYAKVWLNDHYLGEHSGYFQPFEFDATAALRPGTNRLVVDVTCPKEEPGTVWPDQKIMLKGVISHWDCRPGSWDHQTGQDMNSGGIWHDVYLETRPAAYISHIRTLTRLVPEGVPETMEFDRHSDFSHLPRQAMVVVDSEISGAPGEYALVVRVGDAPPVRHTFTHRRSGDRHTVVVPVSNPRLWWTWDLGEPHLETITVELSEPTGSAPIHTRQVEIGLREIRVDPDRGEYWLNGTRFFVRGTNVVPTLWLGEYDAAMIDRDIQMLREAHVNGVRVCVHVNRDEFYTACDRAGLIVWQDFALQWGYAATSTFVQDAARQIRDMIRLLVNHPCIALWVCQNESSFHNKYVLDPVLASVASAEDPSRYVRPTSEFTEHTYGGWYWGHYYDYTALPGTPLLSEFGAQALPNLDSLREMMGDTWPPDWDRMAYHDFQYHQTFHQAKVPMGSSWAEFVQNSQGYQARLLKFALERYRLNKYERLGGLFQFMFMDCWPSITWSVVSYDRQPKQGYFTLQTCLQQVLIGMHHRETVLLVPDRGSHARPLMIQPWVVNDLHQPFAGCTYTVEVSGPGGVFQFTGPESFDVPADGVVKHAPTFACELPASLPSGTYEVRLRLLQGERTLSENRYPIVVECIP